MIIDLAKGVPSLHPERKGKLNRSPKKNWVEKSGGLPPYINSVATALVREGHPREYAIKTAVNMAKKTCATGRIMNLPNKPKVSPAIQAAFCNAVREWEAKKAGARVDASEGAEKLTDREFFEILEVEWDDTLEVDDLSEVVIELTDKWEVEDFVYEGDPVSAEQWLLPFDFSEATRIGATMFKKQIAPMGARVKLADGRVLEFSKAVLEGIQKTFHDKPIDSVPFTLVDDNNRHTEDPERIRGSVEDLSLEEDGLYMIGKLDERGRAMVNANPKLGVSMRYVPEYPGEGGRVYKHALLHVAATPRPRLHGQKPWEAVELSHGHDEMEVIDLSEADWELSAVEDTEGGGEVDKDKKGGDEVTPKEEEGTRADSGAVDLSEEKVQEMIDLAVSEAVKAEKDAREEEVSALKLANRIGEVSRATAQYIDAGVPPFVVNLAAPLLLSNDPSGTKVKYIDLSEDKEEEREASPYELVTKMLSAWPKEVDLSEEDGSRDGEGGDEDTDAMWKAWRARSAPSAMGEDEGGE